MADERGAMEAGDGPRLYADLERVTAQARAAIGGDDVERLAVLAEQRQALVASIERSGVAVDVRAIARILDLDRELLSRVMAWRARLRRDLDHLARLRGSLASYGADLHRGAVYLERTG